MAKKVNEEEKKIVRCKFAGDPEDEYCRECDGLHPVDDEGDTCDAVDCDGYEPEEATVEAPAPKTPASECEKCTESHEANTVNKECPVGITSVIRAESGVSREVNGTWYKFTFSEERILPEGCNLEEEKQALWESVNAEVDAQVEAVL